MELNGDLFKHYSCVHNDENNKKNRMRNIFIFKNKCLNRGNTAIQTFIF